MSKHNSAALTSTILVTVCATACFGPGRPQSDDSNESSSTSDPTTGSTSTSDASTGPSATTTSDLPPADGTSTTLPEPGTTSEVPEESTGEPEPCGNGVVDAREACDDGVNDGSYGGCASDCQSFGPHCGDGIVDDSEACDDANGDSADGCLADCSVPASCMDVHLHDPAAVTGLFSVDADGPGGFGTFDVYCDMDHAGGGWTLVLVSADDGTATWTWDNRELLTTDTTLVGNVAVRDHDFKSAAYHLLSFADLLFVHQPSDTWASYDGVGTGASDIGSFMWALPYPQCDLDTGFAMTDGNLSLNGTALCDTNLYFHPGDYDGSAGNVAHCLNYTFVDSPGAYGPAWSPANNQGCPMDDPESAGLGPIPETCGQVCEDLGRGGMELDGRGFGVAMGVDSPGDRLEMYVR